jgi:hypothetical protein
MKPLVLLSLCAVFLAGCAAIQRAERNSTEQLLSAAGFRILPANTPQRQTSLAELPPYKLHREIRGSDVFYVYASPEQNFAYIGDQSAYSRYQNLIIQQQISDQNMMAAQMASMPGPWGGWGYWGY